MGVFARFRRKGQGGDEKSDTGAAAATPTTEPEGAETASAAAPSAEDKAAERPAEGSGSAADDDKAAEVTGATESAGTEVEDSADGVEIPKQQSADEAADNEADESARK
ncbi:hypothetical protein AB0I16_01970 [Streptomyces sp. NPDC050703]|uniref:hypothetical protein n=1 Tax=Streptomyces sp. NPDC050703 TaxID=3157218 RepID=UPI0034149B7C